MSKIKSIPAKDVEKLIKSLEENYASVLKTAGENHYGSHSMALGSAEVIIKTTIRQLKGEWPIARVRRCARPTTQQEKSNTFIAGGFKMKILKVNILFYICTVITDGQISRYAISFIHNTGNNKPYSLSIIDLTVSLTYGFFIVLLYSLYRKRNIQSLDQKQVVRSPSVSNQSVSNVYPNNSRPSELRNPIRNVNLYVSTTRVLSRPIARSGKWLSRLILINPLSEGI